MELSLCKWCEYVGDTLTSCLDQRNQLLDVQYEMPAPRCNLGTAIPYGTVVTGPDTLGRIRTRRVPVSTSSSWLQYEGRLDLAHQLLAQDPHDLYPSTPPFTFCCRDCQEEEEEKEEEEEEEGEEEDKTHPVWSPLLRS